MAKKKSKKRLLSQSKKLDTRFGPAHTLRGHSQSVVKVGAANWGNSNKKSC